MLAIIAQRLSNTGRTRCRPATGSSTHMPVDDVSKATSGSSNSSSSGSSNLPFVSSRLLMTAAVSWYAENGPYSAFPRLHHASLDHNQGLGLHHFTSCAATGHHGDAGGVHCTLNDCHESRAWTSWLYAAAAWISWQQCCLSTLQLLPSQASLHLQLAQRVAVSQL